MSTQTAPGNRDLQAPSRHARQHKARVKVELAMGEANLLDVLRDPPQSARLDKILLSLPWFGEARVERICTEARLYPRRLLARMSEQERGRLVLYLRKRGWIE